MSDLKYSYTFDPAAENNTAATVARLALTGGTEVLDIGSGPAWVSRYLASEHGRSITCLDNDLAALASVQGAGMRAFEADLESAEWDAAIEGTAFDVVIIADVLEHLREPARILEGLLAGKHLREDGRVVISVPNASHAGVVSELLVGDFNYTDTGILDETHVRWFTLRSLTRLLQRSGYLIDRVERTVTPLEHTPSGERALQIPGDVRSQMNALNPESETYQFIVLASPDSGSNRARAEAESFEADRKAWWSERGVLLSENHRLHEEAESLRGLLKTERARSAEINERRTNALRAKQERIEGLRSKVRALRSRVGQLEAELAGRRGGPASRARASGGRALRRVFGRPRD